MPTNVDILSFILAFIILYFIVGMLSKLRREDVFKGRLQELMHYKERLIQQEDTSKAKAYLKREEEEALSWFQKTIRKLQNSGANGQEHLKGLFDKAGIRSRNALVIYGAAKIGGMLFFGTIAGLISFSFKELDTTFTVGVIILSALIGSFLVDLILSHLAVVRQDRMRKAFPAALDLMVICTEAGLSLTATIQRVAREISQLSPDLGYELALLSIEMNMFSDQRKALQNFSDRMNSPYFKSTITNIMQAQQYGTPIAQTMRALSEQFRFERLVEAEARAAKLPALMSLPMMLLIFPCIYIVILGPAVIKVLETL